MRSFSFKLWYLNEAATELQALKILNNDQQALQQVISVDPSPTKKYLPAIAYFYTQEVDLNTLREYFRKYAELENRRRLRPLQVTNKGVFYDNQLTNFENLKSIINNTASGTKVARNNAMPTNAGKKVAQGDNIEVFESNSREACIKYTSGIQQAPEKQLCIGKPKNIWWQSYRDMNAATFYFVFDKNRPASDPLHVVIINVLENEIHLTDAQNNSPIAEFGDNINGYFHYLTSKGIPFTTFKHIPKTSKEEGDERLIGKPINDLETFKKLGYAMIQRYIGWKHPLTDEQLDWLLSQNQKELVHNYVDATINSDRKKLSPRQEAKLLQYADENTKQYYIRLTQG